MKYSIRITLELTQPLLVPVVEEEFLPMMARALTEIVDSRLGHCVFRRPEVTWSKEDVKLVDI